MLRFEDFAERDQKKRVMVHINGDFENSKVMYMETDWDYIDFLIAASNRLEIVPAAKRVFNANGVEIDDCMMIEDDDLLFLSHGDNFITPTTLLGKHRESVDMGGDDEDDKEREKYPVVVGGYSVGKLLGRGGFGEVRVGIHQLTGEKVALKFLRKSDIHSIGAAERTTTEIQCLTSLKHHNIIRLMHHLETPKHVVLVFELMEGGDLQKFLIARGSSATEIALPEDEARVLFHQIVSAVSYAHNQHICHRDLKLENILLKGPSLAHVKIADFGLSDFYRPGAVMKSNCGTLSFLAPEVFQGTANAGPPLDVWSLGVILFALLCGRLPFEGAELNGSKRPRDVVIKAKILKCQYKIDESLGIEAKDLVRRMLKLDPVERASIPEIFGHVWLRSVVSHHFADAEYSTPQTSRRPTMGTLPSVTTPRAPPSPAVSMFPSESPAAGGRSPFAGGARKTPMRTTSDSSNGSEKSPSTRRARDRARTMGNDATDDDDADSEVASVMKLGTPHLGLGLGLSGASGMSMGGTGSDLDSGPSASASGASINAHSNSNSRTFTPLQGMGSSSDANTFSSRNRQRSSGALDLLGTVMEENEAATTPVGATPKKGTGLRMSVSRSLSSSPTGEMMGTLQALRRVYEREKEKEKEREGQRDTQRDQRQKGKERERSTERTSPDAGGILPPLPAFTNKPPQSIPGTPDGRSRRQPSNDIVSMAANILEASDSDMESCRGIQFGASHAQTPYGSNPTSSLTTPAMSERNSRQPSGHHRELSDELSRMAISRSKSCVTPGEGDRDRDRENRDEHRLPKVMSVPTQSSTSSPPNQLLHFLPSANLKGNDLQRSRHGDDENSQALPRSSTSTPVSFKLEPLRRRITAPEPTASAASDSEEDEGAVTVIAKGKAGLSSGSNHGYPSANSTDSSEGIKGEILFPPGSGSGSHSGSGTNLMKSWPPWKENNRGSLKLLENGNGTILENETSTSDAESPPNDALTNLETERDRQREKERERKSMRDLRTSRGSSDHEQRSLSPKPFSGATAAAGGGGGGAMGNGSELKDSIDDAERSATVNKKKNFPSSFRDTSSTKASASPMALGRTPRKTIDVVPSATFHASANSVLGSYTQRDEGKTTNPRKVIDEFAPAEDTMGLRERGREKEKEKKVKDRDRERERERRQSASSVGASSFYNGRKAATAATQKRDSGAAGGGGSSTAAAAAAGTGFGGGRSEKERRSRADGY